MRSTLPGRLWQRDGLWPGPAGMARRWAQLGAEPTSPGRPRRRPGRGPVQLEVVAAIARAVEIPVELGGGMRASSTSRRRSRLGLSESCSAPRPSGRRETPATRFRLDMPGAIRRQDRDWARRSRRTAWPFAAGSRRRKRTLSSSPPPWFRRDLGGVIYTDISRDGDADGPNLSQLERLTQSTVCR